MKQTHTMSIIETVTSTFVGFVVSVVLTFYALPFWGFEPSWNDSFGITIVFTIASVLRGYFIRRAFNG